MLSGGPDSVHQRGAPRCDPGVFDARRPGPRHLLRHAAHEPAARGRGASARATASTGRRSSFARPGGTLFRAVAPRSRVWMSHGDDVRRAPDGFRVVGRTETNPIAAIEDSTRRLYGMQFHPEVVHTPRRARRSSRTSSTSAAAAATGTRRSFVAEATDRASASRSATGPRHLRALGRRRLLGRGRSSSTARSATARPASSSTTACCARTRRDQVQRRFARPPAAEGRHVDAARRSSCALAGVTDPERKRKIIGREFIEVFEASMREASARPSSSPRARSIRT